MQIFSSKKLFRSYTKSFVPHPKIDWNEQRNIVCNEEHCLTKPFDWIFHFCVKFVLFFSIEKKQRTIKKNLCSIKINSVSTFPKCFNFKLIIFWVSRNVQIPIFILDRFFFFPFLSLSNTRKLIHKHNNSSKTTPKAVLICLYLFFSCCSIYSARKEHSVHWLLALLHLTLMTQINRIFLFSCAPYHLSFSFSGSNSCQREKSIHLMNQERERVKKEGMCFTSDNRKHYEFAIFSAIKLIFSDFLPIFTFDIALTKTHTLYYFALIFPFQMLSMLFDFELKKAFKE